MINWRQAVSKAATSAEGGVFLLNMYDFSHAPLEPLVFSVQQMNIVVLK